MTASAVRESGVDPFALISGSGELSVCRLLDIGLVGVIERPPPRPATICNGGGGALPDGLTGFTLCPPLTVMLGAALNEGPGLRPLLGIEEPFPLSARD